MAILVVASPAVFLVQKIHSHIEMRGLQLLLVSGYNMKIVYLYAPI